jgi:hypothetical protein
MTNSTWKNHELENKSGKSKAEEEKLRTVLGIKKE